MSADEVEVVCGEDTDNEMCGKRVGVIKGTEVGARARCPVHGWVTADEGQLLATREKPVTKVWAHALGPR